MKTEPVTKQQVKSLRKALYSLGSEIVIDWEKIDYEVGRGVIGEKEHCLWTKEGKRINVNIGDHGTIIVKQSKEIDPLYEELKAK